MQSRNEAYYARILADYLKSKGFNVAEEVPFYRSMVDIVAFNKRQVLAIEVKLKNYRKAIMQARNHALFADEVYIALPDVNAKKIDWDALHELGIGVISIGNEITFLRQSEITFKPILRHKNRILKTCSNIMR